VSNRISPDENLNGGKESKLWVDKGEINGRRSGEEKKEG
jgi:hypothetical protein